MISPPHTQKSPTQKNHPTKKIRGVTATCPPRQHEILRELHHNAPALRSVPCGGRPSQLSMEGTSTWVPTLQGDGGNPTRGDLSRSNPPPGFPPRNK